MTVGAKVEVNQGKLKRIKKGKKNSNYLIFF